MNTEEILFQQYKMYAEHKEKFVDRSFTTNKFYLVVVLALILTMYLTKDSTFVYGLSSMLVFSGIGMAVCIMWWVNVDSYNLLIKVKLAKVLEDIEKQLPVQLYCKEFTAIKDYKKNKREFLFADIQKAVTIALFLLFFLLFAYEVLFIIFS